MSVSHSLLTHTNLIVHESLQALNQFMLGPFIDIFLPENIHNIVIT